MGQGEIACIQFEFRSFGNCALRCRCLNLTTLRMCCCFVCVLCVCVRERERERERLFGISRNDLYFFPAVCSNFIYGGQPCEWVSTNKLYWKSNMSKKGLLTCLAIKFHQTRPEKKNVIKLAKGSFDNFFQDSF